jgi:hypothetical protein
MIRALAVACLLALASTGSAYAGDATPPPVASDIPDYVDEAASAGINHTYTGPWEFFVGLDDGFCRDLRGRAEVPDAGRRQLRRPAGAGVAVGHLRAELPDATGGRRHAELF